MCACVHTLSWPGLAGEVVRGVWDGRVPRLWPAPSSVCDATRERSFVRIHLSGGIGLGSVHAEVDDGGCFKLCRRR
ncbi:uncharacterized protein TRAVEDRAFT_30754, partial [Trametes versicolor FP-101664 SS1]|uniref:uncharacterized protein n=1 Tax=Trametes versicolor (strain FP-101664) TaxID=717944 RepID=UPI00046214C4